MADRIAKMEERRQQRQQDCQQLQKSYDEHVRSLRATDDDLDTIAKKLRRLKQMISALAGDFVETADPVRTTSVLRGLWLYLREPIERMGSPLPLNRIRMLTEKYIMDYLMLHMAPNDFPGLSVVKDYAKLDYWLRDTDHHIAIRLRQQLASCIVADESRLQDPQHPLTKEINTASHDLYSNLKNAYPYIAQHDKEESDAGKRYDTLIRKLVQHSMDIVFAMKGQEVDILIPPVQEGMQQFDPQTMIDEDGAISGTIEFCISPPFLVLLDDGTCRVLEKGRMFCVPTSGKNSRNKS